MGRRFLLLGLAIGSGALAVYVGAEALIHDALSRSVVYALLPLVMLFAIALRGLTDKRD